MYNKSVLLKTAQLPKIWNAVGIWGQEISLLYTVYFCSLEGWLDFWIDKVSLSSKKFSLLCLRTWPAPCSVRSYTSRRCQIRLINILGRGTQEEVMHVGWCSGDQAKSNVSEGNQWVCLEKGLQEDKKAWMDYLGNGHGDSREHRDTNRHHVLAASLFGFNSTTLHLTFHIMYCLLTILLNVLQKYGDI